MPTPEQFEHKLRQQYQHEKAMHQLSSDAKRHILKQAKQLKPPLWQGLWRNTQLALSCAMLVVLGYLLLPALQRQPEQAYQVVFSTSSQFKQVQQHSIAAQATPADALRHANNAAYQQYLSASGRDVAFHQQIGLLQQQHEQWQISVCDELLLTVDRELLAQLHLPQQPERFAQQQWVEFISNQAGQLIAIIPATETLQCSGS